MSLGGQVEQEELCLSFIVFLDAPLDGRDWYLVTCRIKNYYIQFHPDYYPYNKINIKIEMQQTENNINNYKGVMLCSRPNENKQSDFEKPFCARVVPHDQLGLVPFARNNEGAHPIKKKPNPILAKHKKWLQQFANTQKLKKELEQHEKWTKQQQFQKLRDQAQQNRQNSRKMKEQLNTITQGVMNVLDDSVQIPKQQSEKKKVMPLNPQNLKKLNDVTTNNDETKKQPFKKKKEKPAWAYSEEEYKKKQQDQDQQLLNFFENTDIDQYVNDIEVSAVLKVLKDKIQSIKKQENWKQKEVKKIKNRQEDEENGSVSGSLQSEGAKSVASERSSKRIQELQKQKIAKQEWDANSKGSKFSANYQQKIAKNVADEVLRNYGNFKGVHSNTSVRKLLQRQALKQFQQKVQQPLISTVNNASIPLNVSNLPYLHRNPSI